MLVTALRGLIEQAGGDFSANMAGKLKMVFQCVAVSLSLLSLMYAGETLPDWLYWSLHISVWVAVLSTVYSGIAYLFAAGKYFRE